VVLEAVRNRGSSLRFASIELRSDFEIVVEAISNNGRALEFAATKLRKDPELISIAEKNLPTSNFFKIDIDGIFPDEPEENNS